MFLKEHNFVKENKFFWGNIHDLKKNEISKLNQLFDKHVLNFPMYSSIIYIYI